MPPSFLGLSVSHHILIVLSFLCMCSSTLVALITYIRVGRMFVNQRFTVGSSIHLGYLSHSSCYTLVCFAIFLVCIVSVPLPAVRFPWSLACRYAPFWGEPLLCNGLVVVSGRLCTKPTWRQPFVSKTKRRICLHLLVITFFRRSVVHSLVKLILE